MLFYDKLHDDTGLIISALKVKKSYYKNDDARKKDKL